MTKPFEYFPRGMRWPWYPVIRGQCVQGMPQIMKHADGTVSYSADLEVIGETSSKRIGVRVWLRYWFRRLLELWRP